jgi:hypothetical protein
VNGRHNRWQLILVSETVCDYCSAIVWVMITIRDMCLCATCRQVRQASRRS